MKDCQTLSFCPSSTRTTTCGARRKRLSNTFTATTWTTPTGSTKPTTTRTSVELIYNYNQMISTRYSRFESIDIKRYAVMENMRHLLAGYDASTPIHLGFRYANPGIEQGFMSGGSGYVLTRSAISRLVQLALQREDDADDDQPLFCMPGHRGAEDYNLGIIDILYISKRRVDKQRGLSRRSI